LSSSADAGVGTQGVPKRKKYQKKRKTWGEEKRERRIAPGNKRVLILRFRHPRVEQSQTPKRRIKKKKRRGKHHHWGSKSFQRKTKGSKTQPIDSATTRIAGKNKFLNPGRALRFGAKCRREGTALPGWGRRSGSLRYGHESVDGTDALKPEGREAVWGDVPLTLLESLGMVFSQEQELVSSS